MGGTVGEKDDPFPGGDLDALATAQEEAEALVFLATENRTRRDDRDKQHQLRMSRGYFPQQQSQREYYSTKRPERKCVVCNGPHWASQCPEKQGNLTETHIFAREALEKRNSID